MRLLGCSRAEGGQAKAPSYDRQSGRPSARRLTRSRSWRRVRKSLRPSSLSGSASGSHKRSKEAQPLENRSGKTSIIERLPALTIREPACARALADPRSKLAERLALLLFGAFVHRRSDLPHVARNRENCEKIVRCLRCEGEADFEKRPFSIRLRREGEEMQSIERHLEAADRE